MTILILRSNFFIISHVNIQFWGRIVSDVHHQTFQFWLKTLQGSSSAHDIKAWQRSTDDEFPGLYPSSYHSRMLDGRGSAQM